MANETANIKPKLTEGEVELYRWQHNNIGSGFKTALWDAIHRADTYNQNALAKGFPEQIEAYRRFAHEREYWEDVQRRYRDRYGV